MLNILTLQRLRLFVLLVAAFIIYVFTQHLGSNQHRWSKKTKAGVALYEEIRWQPTFHTLHLFDDVGIYSTFLDRRPGDNNTERRTLDGHRYGVLRIFLAKTVKAQPRIFCHFMELNGDVRTVGSRDLKGNRFAFTELSERHNKLYGGFSTHCDLPTFINTDRVGISTSDVFEINKTLILPINVIYKTSSKIVPLTTPDKTIKHIFGLCVPPLRFISQLDPIKFREWFMFNIKFGVTIFRIYYSEEISKQLRGIIDFVRAKGITVILTPYFWSNKMERIRNQAHEYLQLVSVNDCLYRTMNDARFVLFADIDELLVPKLSPLNSWTPLVRKIWELDSDSIDSRRNFLPGVCFPSYLFTRLPGGQVAEASLLTNFTLRSTHLYKERCKCLVRPMTIFDMGIHHLNRKFTKDSVSFPIRGIELTKLAILHHYREKDI